MKLSLKVEYACRVLAQLARVHGQGSLAHIEELAQAEEVPSNYLVQILNELRNGHLIVSRRGKQGGYALARSPEEITLQDIVAIMEGELIETSATPKGQSGPQISAAWEEVSRALREKLMTYRLSDLAAKSDEMYYI